VTAIDTSQYRPLEQGHPSSSLNQPVIDDRVDGAASQVIKQAVSSSKGSISPASQCPHVFTVKEKVILGLKIFLTVLVCCALIAAAIYCIWFIAPGLFFYLGIYAFLCAVGSVMGAKQFGMWQVNESNWNIARYLVTIPFYGLYLFGRLAAACCEGGACA
jgi:hypothetical protein